MAKFSLTKTTEKKATRKHSDYFNVEIINVAKPAIDYDVLNRIPWLGYGKFVDGDTVTYSFIQLHNPTITQGRAVVINFIMKGDELKNRATGMLDEYFDNIREVPNKLIVDVLQSFGNGKPVNDLKNSLVTTIEFGV